MADTIPSLMQCITVTHPGDPSVMAITSAPLPHVGPHDVLIQVAAAGVNRPDLMQRQGYYPPPPGASLILGLEVAGTIVACGSDVQQWQVGNQVCALLAGGGYATYCAAPETQCLPIPAGLSLVEAASLPETFFTVWTNVFQRAHLMAGESILVHGGSGGIGITAIQLAHAFDARVFATAGSNAKCDACLRYGADVAINYHTHDFVDAVRRQTNGNGVNVILDMVGGSYLSRNLAALAPKGRLVQIAFMEGRTAELDLSLVMTKRLTITGSTLRPRSVAEKGEIAQALRTYVWPLLERGAVRPVIETTFPLEHAAAAHELMESGGHVGKIVLVT
jgi:putative PIG3 family NAD(P)H quinone oxidoreductase